MDSSTSYVDTGQWLLERFGISGFILVSLFLASGYLCYQFWKLYNPILAELLRLRLEKTRIQNELLRNTISDKLMPTFLAGQFAKLEVIITDEIIRIFDINDRHSKHRQQQIPIELQQVTSRALKEVMSSLHYNSEHTICIESIKSRFSNGDFWEPICDALFAQEVQYARTSAINILKRQLESELSKSIETYKK